MCEISQSDWRRCRDLKEVALERYCTRVLSDIERKRSESTISAHERYLNVYRLIRERDRELGQIFDDLRRSNAVQRLRLMQRAGLLTDEQIDSFSEAIRSEIRER